MLLVKTNRNFLPSIFDEVFSNEFFKSFGEFGSIQRDYGRKPKVNYSEDELGYNVELAIPGIPKDELKVKVKDNILTVFREEKKETKNEEKKYSFREFSYDSFEQNFNIPEKADINGISSRCESGILFINIPKDKEKISERVIEIQ